MIRSPSSRWADSATSMIASTTPGGCSNQPYAKLRAIGEDRLAARVAIDLTDLHASMLGNVSAGRGWAARARRVLGTIGPGPEWGYLELAIMACARPDVDELLASADRALAIAAEFADTDLEVRALADSGLSLVSQGRMSEGFARLDEALATIYAGEIRQPTITGQAFCSMLSSCDRAQDVARAEEWIRLVDDLVLSRTGGRPPVLYTHCAGAYGSVLIDAGRWDEAEAALTDALGPRASACVGHRIDSTAALARLRVEQGRVDEAADLLANQEDRLPSCLPLAEVHLRRGDADLAAAVARRGVDELVGDASRSVPLLVLLVEAQIAAGRPDDASEAVRDLERLAERSGSGGFAPEVALCRGRVLVGERRCGGAIGVRGRARRLAGRLGPPDRRGPAFRAGPGTVRCRRRCGRGRPGARGTLDLRAPRGDGVAGPCRDAPTVTR